MPGNSESCRPPGPSWRNSWPRTTFDHLAAAMEPGSTAGVLIWENLWAAPFASAVRHSGGQLIANGRIPLQAIIASIKPTRQP